MCLVDYPSGRLSQVEPDFHLPGPIPLVLERIYRSSIIWRGDLGYGWGHAFGVRLWMDEYGAMVFRGGDGRRIILAPPSPGVPSISSAEQVAFHAFSPGDLPWPAVAGEVAEGAIVVQSGDDPSLVFDSIRHGGFFPLRAIADRVGNVVAIAPGLEGLPARATDTRGRVLTFERDREGRLREVRLAGRGERAERRLIAYDYDSRGDLVAAHDAAGTRTYHYRDHLLVRHLDRCGGACEAEYDHKGRCIRTCGAGNTRRRTYEYDEASRTTTVRDSHGATTIYRYDEAGMVTEIVDPAGGISRFEYDEQGRVSRARDQIGGETILVSDGNGRALAKVRPDGSASATATNGNGELIETTSRTGATTQFVRDELGGVVEVLRSGEGPWCLSYADDGSIASITRPNGTGVSLKWTQDGRNLSVSDAEGILSEDRFDILGRRVLERDALGAETRYRYDEKGYLSEIEYPDGARRGFSSDAEGRVLSFRDELGHTTRWEYDDAGRCVAVRLPTGQAIRTDYDLEGRIVEILWPDGLRHCYQYDARGLVTRQEFSDGRVEEYEYDPRGLLAVMTVPSGDRIEVRRDPVGRIVSIRYPDGTEKTEQHDAESRWLRAEWAGHVRDRELTPEGFPILERQDGFVLIREPDADTGEVASILDGLGRKVEYARDEAGRLAEVCVTPGRWDEDAWSPTGPARVHRFQHDRVGNLVAWEMPSGKVEERAYDARRRLVRQIVRLGDRILLSRDYAYNPAGLLASLADSRAGMTRYQYDRIGRLTTVEREGSPRLRLDYNEAGDLITGGLVHAPGHRVLRTPDQELHYDRMGFVTLRKTPRGTDEFSYTTHGLLREARLAGGARARWEYDPRSRLVGKQIAEEKTRYHWCDDWLWAVQVGDRPPVELLHAPGMRSPIEQAEGDRTYTIHSDHLGKVRELIDEEGHIVWTAPEGIWGDGRANPEDGAPDCPLGFPGQVWDGATGFYFNRFRYYDPTTAHFLTPDPIGIWGGHDAYRYPQDPVNFIDPFGLACRGKTDDPTLYRGDGRPPEIICKEGFKPSDPTANVTLLKHVNGPPPRSNWISTTYSQKMAEKAAKWGEGRALRDNVPNAGQYVYAIDNPGCGQEVDCDPEVIADGVKHGAPSSEQEIAFNKAIPPNKITGWYKVSPGGTATFQPCPP